LFPSTEWLWSLAATISMNPRRLRFVLLLSVAASFSGALPTANGEPAPIERHGLPKPGSDLVGSIRSATVRDEETLLDIAREQGIGQEEILNANPGVDRWLPPPGTEVVIPGRRLLPEAARKGIVINLPEYRLYYFPEPTKKNDPREVVTVPISVGRMDWKTPLGLTRITSKQKNPAWIPPASIRAEHEADGDMLPPVVPPGPDNPLGAYALRLGIPGYLIHGTDKEFGVGMRVTHGCMRLLPEHIEALFRLAPVGTPVRLTNQPIKLGWGPDALYLEVHPPLEEDDRELEDLIAETLAQARQGLAGRPDLALDEAMVAMAIIEKSGLPVPITWQESPRSITRAEEQPLVAKPTRPGEGRKTSSSGGRRTTPSN
jgi:L,D-transpeptidase ErfK/SrfK